MKYNRAEAFYARKVLIVIIGPKPLLKHFGVNCSPYRANGVGGQPVQPMMPNHPFHIVHYSNFL
ncbi:hypothetical protein KVR801_140066 [Klebsiella variicola]|nr:hypothetical protein KVR801_140066 [Klebsiella variicola]